MTSLKKLIAVLAVSLPLAASAQQAAPAPAPLYQWYGTLNVNGQYVEASKPFKVSPAATPVNMTGRFSVSVDSSNIGIRGTADFGQGAGLGAVYQCETSASIDGIGANVGGSNAITGPLASALQFVCNRNSRLGLSSDYGTLFYGNWDTPLKAAAYGTKADDPFGNTDVYDVAAIIGSPGFKTKSSAGATITPVAGSKAAANEVGSAQLNFNVRAANSIAYHSPKYEGLQLKAQYSVNENAGLDGAISPQLWSAALNYDRGPFSIFAAYERHDDWMGINAIGGATTGGRSTTDTSFKFGAGFELASAAGATTLGVQFDMLDYKYASTTADTTPGTLKEASRNAYMIGLKHRMGDHEFRLRFSQALDLDPKYAGPQPATAGADGKKTGAMNYALGYAYYLSKAAQVYAFVTYLDNADFATYTFATAGPPSLTAGWGAGANLTAGGLGMRYAF